MAKFHIHSEVLRRLANDPHNAKESITLPVLQKIMLETGGVTMAAGLWFDIVSERLCPGVYRVSLKLKKVCS